MGITISKKDVIWSFVAKFFQIATGFLTLPLILNKLSAEEVGLNYLMLTISSMVALLDFGFSPQFGRNFTYVHSGASYLLKEGVDANHSNDINYHLLSVLLKTARFVYRRLSIICLILMLTAGTAYIYRVTEGFAQVDYSFWIWVLFSISTYFNIYFSYYNGLLTGSGKVAEANIATILSKATYLVLCIVLLLFDIGLFAVIIANFISPFVLRLYSYKKYFTKELRYKLDSVIDKKELKETFQIIWYNAKKLGINFLGAYAINKSAMFIIGFFLSLEEIASYGLMVQLGTLLVSIAQTLFITYQPKFASCRVEGDKERFKYYMCITVFTYWLIMIAGSILIILFADKALDFIHSNAVMPSLTIIIIYLIAQLLEGNHSLFAMLIVSNNEVPFVKAALVSGGIIILFTTMLLQFTDLKLLGVVIVPLIVQACYNNWRWPKWVLNSIPMTVSEYQVETYNAVKQVLKKYFKI